MLHSMRISEDLSLVRCSLLESKNFRLKKSILLQKLKRKVGLAQHPDFLRAMNLTEQENYPDALILLHRVVRDDPNHLEAYMEMRRIAEINKDAAAYNRLSVSIFDILLAYPRLGFAPGSYTSNFRVRRFGRHYRAKSLLGLGTYFEETLDFRRPLNIMKNLSPIIPGIRLP